MKKLAFILIFVLSATGVYPQCATYYYDSDGDGYGGQSSQVWCGSHPSYWVSNNLDCNDGNPGINPSRPEICNSTDDNCDGAIDEGLVFTTYYLDYDHDGYGSQNSIYVCYNPGSNYVTNNTDCNDYNINIHPGAQELCSFEDENCINGGYDGVPFYTYYYDSDGDGFGSQSQQDFCSTPPSYWVTNNSDCNDGNPAINPNGTETCGGDDENCDGQFDEGIVFTTYYYDGDGDGYGGQGQQTICYTPASYWVTNNLDCDDTSPYIHPGAPEICGGADENCNGQYNEGLIFRTYYYDGDSDGYGGSATNYNCAPISPFYKITGGDCNDFNPNIHPGKQEIQGNSIDENCNGNYDEDSSQTVNASCNCGGQAQVLWYHPSCNNYNDGSMVGVTTVNSCSLTVFTIYKNGAYYSGPFYSSFSLVGLSPATYLVEVKFVEHNGNECIHTVTGTIINPPPIEVSLNGLNHFHFYGEPVVPLTGTPPGGIFIGPGINGTNFYPMIAGIGGPYEITYMYTSPGGCTNTAKQLVTVVPDGQAVMQMKVFLSSMYNTNENMNGSLTAMLTDTVEVSLAEPQAPYNIVYTSRTAISTTGDGVFDFPPSVNGNDYYIVVRHRNSIETWSKFPVTFSPLVSFDFAH